MLRKTYFSCRKVRFFGTEKKKMLKVVNRLSKVTFSLGKMCKAYFLFAFRVVGEIRNNFLSKNVLGVMRCSGSLDSLNR